MTTWKKALASVLLIIGIALIIAPVTRNAVFNNILFQKMDGVGNEYVNDSLKKTTAAFALSRAVNGAISILQESEIQATIFGAGVSIAAGQILDPVNDLIERFSWILLASMTSLGVQKFIIQLGIWLSILLILSASLGIILLGLWWPFAARIKVMNLGYRMVLLSLLIRLFIPAAGWANHEIYRIFLEKEYDRSIEKINLDDWQLTGPDSQLAWDKLRNMKLEEKLEEMKSKMAEITEYVVNLIIVFLVQTIVLPLLTAWIFLKCLRITFVSPLPQLYPPGVPAARD